MIDSSFQGINRLFAFSFEDNAHRTRYTGYFLPKVEIKGYNVKTDLRKYDKIRKIAASQGDDYTTGCLVDYPNFKEYYKLISIDLNKQKALDTDPKAINKLILQGI